MRDFRRQQRTYLVWERCIAAVTLLADADAVLVDGVGGTNAVRDLRASCCASRALRAGNAFEAVWTVRIPWALLAVAFDVVLSGAALADCRIRWKVACGQLQR